MKEGHRTKLEGRLLLLRWALPIGLLIAHASFEALEHYVIEGEVLSLHWFIEVFITGGVVALALWWLLGRAFKIAGERTALEQSLREYAKTLETTVAERTKDLEKRNAELTALRTITREVSLLSNFDDTLRTILEQIMKVVGCESGGIRTIDREEGVARFRVHKGLSRGFLEKANQVPLGECLCGQVTDSTLPSVVINDIPEFASDPDRTRNLRDTCVAMGYRSLALLPIKSGDNVMGVLYLASYAKNRFDEEKVEFLKAACNEIGIVMENALAYEQARAAAARMETLHKIGEDLLATTTEERAVEVVMKSIERRLGYQRGWLALVDRNRGVLKGKTSFGTQKIPPLTYASIPLDPSLKNPALFPFFARKPIVVNDLLHDSRCADVREAFTTLGLKSFAFVPLLARDEVMGVIGVSNLDRATSFSQEDLGFLTAFATLAGLSISAGRLHDQVQKQAITDGLTGFYNRRHFHRVLGEEIQRAKRYKHEVALVLMDIDDLKGYNDALGHLEGDEALKGFAQEVREIVRSVDIPCRYGGDEFVIILPETGRTDALLVAQRIQSAFDNASFHAGKLSVSFGVAAYPGDAEAENDLIRVADRVLYGAKGITQLANQGL